MKNSEFIENVLKTENKDYKGMQKRLKNVNILRLLHASDILCTEAGELKDAIKKHIFYGSPLDINNVKEELGDALYAIGLGIDVLSSSFEKVMEINSNKLKERYGDKFTKNRAINRNLNKEREIIDEKI